MSVRDTASKSTKNQKQILVAKVKFNYKIQKKNFRFLFDRKIKKTRPRQSVAITVEHKSL